MIKVDDTCIDMSGNIVTLLAESTLCLHTIGIKLSKETKLSESELIDYIAELAKKPIKDQKQKEGL